jgi:sulfonate transport system substrate-binding protein
MRSLNRHVVVGMAAFQRGAVDAWAIWDPFFVAAQKQIGARVLTDAKGITNRY